MLTLPKIKNAKPSERPYKLADGQGLTLLVKPDGAKSWRFRFRYAGKENMLGLGNWPEVSIAEARRQRDDARAQLRAGIDPASARRKTRATREAVASNTFEAVAEDWIESKKAKWIATQQERIRRSLVRDILPALGKRPVAEITAAEVLAVVQAVEQRGALDQASRVLQRMTAIFARSVQTQHRRDNPARELRGVVKSRRVQHRPALPLDRFPDFLARMDRAGADPLTKAGLMLIIMTACRVNEVLRGNWSEIDLDARLWRIPGERMKMHVAHDVPLSAQACALLDGIRPLASKSGLVFPSPMKRGAPLHNNALLLYLRRMHYKTGDLTIHGFRATFSTWANESGYDPDVIERCLAHQDRNVVRRTYNRAQHLDDRRKLLQAWADMIDAKRAGAAVVPIRRKTQ